MATGPTTLRRAGAERRYSLGLAAGAHLVVFVLLVAARILPALTTLPRLPRLPALALTLETAIAAIRPLALALLAISLLILLPLLIVSLVLSRVWHWNLRGCRNDLFWDALRSLHAPCRVRRRLPSTSNRMRVREHAAFGRHT